MPAIASTGAQEPQTGRTPAVQRVEAVLMLAREPLSGRKIAQLALLEDGTQARTLLRRLNELYDAAGGAFRVEEVAGGYQLLTRPKFASWLRRLGQIPAEVRLSAPALETLAVVAYRQPVLKADIEAIRGVQCGEILRQLMERDLVRIGGRSEELGRPYLYTTTKRFLQQFGLRSLEDLPRAEILRGGVVPPVGKAVASGHHTSQIELATSEPRQRSIVDKASVVSVTLSAEFEHEETQSRRFGAPLLAPVRAEDDDDDLDDEDEEDDDLDDDDEDEEEDELEDDDEDFEDDEEWEEVEDEDELDEEDDDEDWDDDEEEEWDEEDDDDDDDDDEEEEEEWEEE
jgi:segregation and condensation protein B